jgi:hypothetical protein
MTAMLLAQLGQVPGVGAFMISDYHHGVALHGQKYRF